jgi:eukaryotic-like serine/threonine-protein kinase
LTREEWLQVWAAFESACELAPEERPAYLASALPAGELRNRAMELLADEQEDSPIAEPGPQPNRPGKSLVGEAIGRFQIVGRLGRGGMGDVYRAFDPELGRHVAIKFIPVAQLSGAGIVSDPIREARAASALNHPGIVTVFEVIRTADSIAIVMEFVDGRPVRELTGKPYSLAEVALWGQRIAEALAATHAGGILHRDIKPENLILRRDGYVKILDFGLAAEPAAFAGGLPFGTVRYMSPEQAKGTAPLTPASDIFSLGVVLYELAAGVHPFATAGQSNTTTSVASAVVSGMVLPPSSVSPSLPRAFDALIARMLDPEPGRRPTADAVAHALKALPHTGSRRRRVLLAGVLGMCAAAVLGIVAFILLKPQAPPVEIQGTLLTGSPGRETGPSFSPDGQSVAYAWDGGHGGKRDIWVKRLNSSDPRRFSSSPEDEWDPCWLPDKSAIAFLRVAPSAYEVVTVPLAGGPEAVVTTISAMTPWLDHRLDCAAGGGLIILDEPPVRSTNQHLRLYSISLPSGERRLISDTPPGASDSWPRVSPDGRRVAFARIGDGFDLRVVDIAGGASHTLARGAELKGLTWTTDGQSLLYEVEGTDAKNIWQISASGGRPLRPPFVTQADAEEIALSPDGRKLAYSRGSDDWNVWRVFTDGRPSAELAPSTRIDDDGIWSPDGTKFAFSSDRSGQAEIWVASAAGTNARRVTNLNGRCGSPAWSPDGKWLAFDYSGSTAVRVAIVPVDGGPARVLPDSTVGLVPSWSRDGKWIFFESRRTGNYEIWKVPAAGGSAIRVTHHGGFESRAAADGKYLYYSKMSAKDIWRTPVSGDGPEEKMADFDPATQFRCWDLTAQGLAISFPDPRPHVELLPFGGGRIPIVTLPADLPKYSRCFSIHPDGQSLLYPVEDAERWEIYVADTPASK